MNPAYQIRNVAAAPARNTSTYTKWRLAGLGLVFITLGFSILNSREEWVRGVARYDIVVGVCAILAIPSMLLAVSSARHFGQGQLLRRAWFMVAPLGVIDCLLLAVYMIPGVLAGGPRPNEATAMMLANVVLVGTALTGLSRFMLASVLWKMIGLYRGLEFRIRLRTGDYAAMAVLLAMGIVSAAYASSGMGAQLQNLATVVPAMMRWFELADWFRLVPLSLCSVLGVIAWRYAADSGGGLVAKAWRGVLLYAVAYLVRLAYMGLSAHFIATGQMSRSTIAGVFLSTGGMVISQYMLFLGASYQHEACTGSVEFDRDQLDAAAAAEQP